MAMAAPILVGTCNWMDHKSFYPAHLERGRQKEKLTYYARYFPMVEVDSTFYGIPSPLVVAGWLQRTPSDFRFNVKAYRSLTRHERSAGETRPPTEEEERDFMAALLPLRDAGRLVAVHYQFPPWFTNTPQSRDVLLEARDRHPEDILAVEFRHRSWYDKGAWPRTEELLTEMDAVYVGVDAPQLGSGTAPPLMAVTSPRLAIARLHGRNYKTWYIRGAKSSGERFDYLYSPDELRDWVPAIQAAAAAGVPVHVVMNNNRSNYAVVNAFDMAALLSLPLPRPPGPILETLERRDGQLPAWVTQAEPLPEDAGREQLALGLDSPGRPPRPASP
jgi:uncharacterized protein YecE (DUF72 family)